MSTGGAPDSSHPDGGVRMHLGPDTPPPPSHQQRLHHDAHAVELGTATTQRHRDPDGVDAQARAHAQNHAAAFDAKHSPLHHPSKAPLTPPSHHKTLDDNRNSNSLGSTKALGGAPLSYHNDSAISEQLREQQEKNAQTCRGRLNRRWKASKLYQLTSSGHEDACAYECSNVGGRTCGYWPPLYPPERLRASIWLRLQRFWVFYIRPWIFMLGAVLLVLYFFVVMNNIATWRTNELADSRGYLPAVGLDKNRPAAEQLPPDQIFILPDVMHNIFSAASGSSYLAWDYFVDMSLVVAIVVSLGLRLYQRDFVRLGEWAVIEVVMFGAGGILHALTVYPDPWGSNKSCQQTDHRSYGSWVWTNLTTEYCGDQMYSGHTFNFIVAVIMFRRSVYELLGWDSLPWTTLTHSVGGYLRKHDCLAQLAMTVRHGGSAEEAQARAPCLSRDGTQNRAVLAKHPDSTSLPGIDREGEMREAQQPRPIGSAVPIFTQLAAAEGLGKSREVELARLLRMPVYAHHTIDAQDPTALHLQLAAQGHDSDDLDAAAAAGGAQAVRGALRVKVDEFGSTAAPQQSANNNNSSSLVPMSHSGAQSQQRNAAGSRVVQVYNGPCGHVLPPEAGNGSLRDHVAAPLRLPGSAFQLTAPIPATRGGTHLGGHYGAEEESANRGRLLQSQRCRSDLPAPEWDDARGHGMNPFYRYRINMPVHERMVVSRGPSPYFVRAHPHAVWWAGNLIRLAVLAWTIVFLIGIWKIRYHYATDVLISAFIALLVCCNEKLIQTCVPHLYLPVDARYADAPPYPLSIEPQLYEENISKLGVGGIF